MEYNVVYCNIITDYNIKRSYIKKKIKLLTVNISNRKKQLNLKSNNQNVVTPLLNSLENSTIDSKKNNKINLKMKTNFFFKQTNPNLFQNKNIQFQTKKINPKLIKIKNYLNALKNISNIKNKIIVQSKKETKIENQNEKFILNKTMDKKINLNNISDIQQLLNQIKNHSVLEKNPQTNLIQKIEQNNPNNIDLSNIKSLNSKDNFTKIIKNLANSIHLTNLTKNQTQIKQQKKNEFIISENNQKLELRKYLKSLFKFQSDIAFNQTIVYKFNHNSFAHKFLKNFSYILKNSFLIFNYIISKPILEMTPNKLTIKLFYYDSNTKQKFWMKNYMLKNINYLCLNLSKILNISVVIDLVKLQRVQSEGQILANSFSFLTDNLGHSFRYTAEKIFRTTFINNPGQFNKSFNKMKRVGNKTISLYTGINVKLAGRLIRQPIIPRLTVKKLQIGSLTRRYSDFLTISKYTTKNRRGIFSYTIKIGHKFY